MCCPAAASPCDRQDSKRSCASPAMETRAVACSTRTAASSSPKTIPQMASGPRSIAPPSETSCLPPRQPIPFVGGTGLNRFVRTWRSATCSDLRLLVEFCFVAACCFPPAQLDCVIRRQPVGTLANERCFGCPVGSTTKPSQTMRPSINLNSSLS